VFTLYMTGMLFTTPLRILALFALAPYILSHASTTEQVVWKTTGDNSTSLPDKPWDARPHPDATGHLIFNTVHSLLHRWSNSIHKIGIGLPV